MTEADVLADRVVGLTEGIVVCNASPNYLKSAYGVGYKIRLVKSPWVPFQRKQVLSIVQKYVPGAEMLSDAPAQATIALHTVASESFDRMFRELEKASAQLGVRSVGLGVCTLKDIYLKLTLASLRLVKSPMSTEPQLRAALLEACVYLLQSGQDLHVVCASLPPCAVPLAVIKVIVLEWVHHTCDYMDSLSVENSTVLDTFCKDTDDFLGTYQVDRFAGLLKAPVDLCCKSTAEKRNCRFQCRVVVSFVGKSRSGSTKFRSTQSLHSTKLKGGMVQENTTISQKTHFEIFFTVGSFYNSRLHKKDVIRAAAPEK
ncbi:uncharacterized protein LOC142578581 [Dermacentor variabilis]|uniref:uncharacterized protein LOC142578581 n=1 Tax=Dermacentor variabilis TaxID=34621 RepID=UPI003F5C28C3